MYSDMRMLAGRIIMDGMGPMQEPRWATGMVKVRPGAVVIALMPEHRVPVPRRSS